MEQISNSENVELAGASLQEDLKESGTNEEFWPQEEESRVVYHIKERLGALRNEDSHATIFGVPQWIKKHNRYLYEPKMVSIGPYHHRREHLSSVEEEKWYSLRDFLSRNGRIRIDDYVRAINELKSTARRCYLENFYLDNDEFVAMLLLDGCFILEFFLKNDPGQFDPRWDTNSILSDLLLLENQIPFFVLHKLYVIYGGCYQGCYYNYDCDLVNLIIKFLPHNIIRNRLPSTMTGAGDIHHLIHLLYMLSSPNYAIEDTNKAQRSDHVIQVPDTVHKKLNGFEELEHVKADIWVKTMPSATDLQKAGVTFRRKIEPRHFFDITFKGGIMEMPFFIVGGASTTILMNMIAFEQMQPPGSKIFTSYVVLKDSLINTGKDIALLEKSGVLANLFDNKEQAADVFNDLGNNVILEYDNHYYADLFREIRRFNNSTWHSYRARLFRDFTTNPWTLISVVTGAIALILTFIQTYYAGIQTHASKP